MRYSDLSTLIEFAESADRNALSLVSLLSEIRSRGEIVVGIGAPMKASTLLNYCRIGPRLLRYLTEVNPLKIGKYMPGVHTPVIDEDELFRSSPDYALILSWNISDEIMKKFRARGYRGKFIIPIPSVRILS